MSSHSCSRSPEKDIDLAITVNNRGLNKCPGSQNTNLKEEV